MVRVDVTHRADGHFRADGSYTPCGRTCRDRAAQRQLILCILTVPDGTCWACGRKESVRTDVLLRADGRRQSYKCDFQEYFKSSEFAGLGPNSPIRVWEGI